MTQEQTLITTSLNKIRAHSPCESGWQKLLKYLGKTKADDEPIKFSTIIQSNGLDDALWCLRSICPDYEKEVRLFAADCAARVLHIFEKEYPNDNRPRLAIEAARKFARGEITQEELAAARSAAMSAAKVVEWDAANYSASSSARSAARAAVRSTASSAASSAAWDASISASISAAWDDARDDARDAQIEMLTESFS